MARRDPITVLTPPAAEPVTRAELVAQMMLNVAPSDAELDRWIKAARELFEKQTGRAVLPTAFRQHCSEFSGPIDLQAGPVISVQAVNYIDRAEAAQALGSFDLDAAEIPATVYVASGVYPLASTKKRRPVTIDFTAGWANAAAVPAMVKGAILLLAAHFYQNREAYLNSAFEMRTMPQGWERVVELHRTGLEWAS